MAELPNATEWSEANGNFNRAFDFTSSTRDIEEGSEGPDQVREITDIPIMSVIK